MCIGFLGMNQGLMSMLYTTAASVPLKSLYNKSSHHSLNWLISFFLILKVLSKLIIRMMSSVYTTSY